MKRRVFIVHGWESYPEDCWFPWLKRELESRDFKVFVPRLPHPDFPEIKSWVKALGDVVGEVDSATYFVGHSVGCQTILRYLETQSAEKRIGGAVFVGGWFSLKGLRTKEEKIVAAPWLDTPINFEKLRKIIPKSVAIFSDDDRWVSISNIELFATQLCSKTIVEHEKGHFDRAHKIFELPSVLESIALMSN